MIKIFITIFAVFAIIQCFFLLFFKEKDSKFTFKDKDKIITVFIQSVCGGLLFSFILGMLVLYASIIIGYVMI